jgi:tetratricopeptide (TPR) repeat protein
MIATTSAWRPLVRLSRWQLRHGDPRGALRSARRAMRLVSRPGVAEHDRNNVQWLLGRALLACGANGEAIGVLKQIVVSRAARPLLARDLATALARVGRYDEAEDAACAVLVGDPVSQELEGSICIVLGNCARARGDHEIAVGWYRQAETALRSHDRDHPDLAALWQARATLALEQGDALTALSWARLGQWHRRRRAGNDRVSLATGLLQLAAILAATGQVEAAELELAQALPVVTRLGSDADRAHGAFVAATVHRHAGRPDMATADAQRALALQQRTLGWGHPELMPTLSLLLELARDAGDRSSAERYEREVSLVANVPPAAASSNPRPHLQLVPRPLAA